MNTKKIVVPVSGGMDSTVLLFKAAEEYDNIFAVTFDYGQRHIEEINAANCQIAALRFKYPKKIIEHKIINVRYIPFRFELE